MGEGDDDAGDGSGDVQCALVEYASGKVQTRKWTLELGHPYEVGRKDSGADIEVDHPSLSRRQCTIAVTRDEMGEMTLVLLDPGSTNGTYVDKTRLLKGVGLKKKLSDFQHMSFGECRNGYRILVRGDASPPAAAGTADTAVVEPPAEAVPGSSKRGGALSEAQKAQLARLSRLADFDKKERQKEAAGQGPRTESSGAGGSAAPAAGGTRRERREGKPQNAEADGDRSRSRDAKLPHGEEQRAREGGGRAPSRGAPGDGQRSSLPKAWRTQKGIGGSLPKDGAASGKGANIDWPEDWK